MLKTYSKIIALNVSVLNTITLKCRDCQNEVLKESQLRAFVRDV